MILITRPLYKSQIIANRLQDRGYKTIISPLFEVEYNSEYSDLSHLKDLQAILITSDNAVYSLEKLNLDKKIKILAVGKVTADAIMAKGYDNVIYASNSADSLKKLAINNLEKDKGYIVYLAGKLVTLDLAEELSKIGFKSKRINVYSIKGNATLSQEVIDKICNNSIDKVLIYSKNTAMIFYELIKKYNLLEYFDQIKLLCLSDKIADYCNDLGFKKVGNINQLNI